MITRGRDLGIPFDGIPGTYNAITDVDGVEVGHTTLISGAGPLEVGKGPVRTGVTVVLPHGKRYQPAFAAWDTLNGCGEMTGTTWVEESGFLESGIAITNTISIGTVHDAMVKWSTKNLALGSQKIRDVFWFLPVVAETTDMTLNDIAGFHVTQEHVFQALNTAAGGPVAEGNVGGGTGMICHDFKGGIGTSSREIRVHDGCYTLGVLVQANYGDRQHLTIAGVPVGKEIPDLMPEIHAPSIAPVTKEPGSGSIITVLATDAPLLPHQLKRLARRVSLGVGKMGGMGTNSSGDISIAFSTADREKSQPSDLFHAEYLANARMNPLFEATIQATEEAIVNALVAATTMTGINGNKVYALPHDRLIEILKKYNRLQPRL
jgi:D-aminopeptidase